MLSLVSIIIPYYNRPEKLERCINSILSQSFKNYEIIVIDDCSNLSFENHKDKIQYFRNEKNLGPGPSRNKGLSIAKGNYVAFLDCDDYWHKNFLKTLVTELESNIDAVMAYAEGVKVNAFDEIQGKRRNKMLHPTSILPLVLYRGRPWGTGGCLWKKEIIKDIKWISTRNWEDNVFDISVAVKNNTILPVKQVLVYYDMSGEDKLSKQNIKTALIEKNKSLNIASEILYNTIVISHKTLNKHITVLILINLVKLIENDVTDMLCYKRSINSLKKWRNPFFSSYVYLVCFLPDRYAIGLLLRLKKSINRDLKTFIG